MRHIKKIIILCLFAAILVGCAGTYKPITQYKLQGFKTATVISNIPDNEIGKQITNSSKGKYGGFQANPAGALIGAVVVSVIDAGVDSNRAKRAKESINRFLLPLKEEDISGFIQNKLNENLNSLSWTAKTEFQQAEIVDNVFSTLLVTKKFNTDIVVFINTDYSFTPNFETIELTSDYWVYVVRENGFIPVKGDTQYRPKHFYRNQAVYQGKIFPPANKRYNLPQKNQEEKIADINAIYNPKIKEEQKRGMRTALNKRRLKEIGKVKRSLVLGDSSNLDGARWFENNAKLTKEALIDGSEEIAKMIAMDLNGEATNFENLDAKKYHGVVLYLISKDEANGRGIYRVGEDNMRGKLVSKTIDGDYLVKAGRERRY